METYLSNKHHQDCDVLLQSNITTCRNQMGMLFSPATHRKNKHEHCGRFILSKRQQPSGPYSSVSTTEDDKVIPLTTKVAPFSIQR